MAPTPPDPPYRSLSSYLHRIPAFRPNTRTHPSTLGRWCTTGVKLPDGTRLRLRAVRLGSRWATTDAWFAEFVDALTAAHVGPAGPAPARTPGERARASRQAEARLREQGL